MKTLSILGSTGSIGIQILDIVKQNPEEFKIAALSCNNNIELLKKQIKEFNPEVVAVYNEEQADQLNTDIEVLKGMSGLKKIASLESADTVVNSLVGSIGVLPTIEAINAKKNIALANKETLVTAGRIVMEKVKNNNINLMPIDSEHSAIFQCLNREDKKTVNKIMITCSGGAFKNKTKEELKAVKAADALAHPTWNMGPKITIDCATLMNKGFEVIEAHFLYDIPYEKIEVIIHPESIVHSFVEFNDRSILAQLGKPDMRIPIQYALTYPKRIKNNMESLDIAKLKTLNFKDPDFEMFPCLKYAYDAGNTAGTMPAILNAANEIAVKYFLKDKIRFLDIPKLIKEAIDNHELIKNPDLDEIMEVDRKVKQETEKAIIK